MKKVPLALILPLLLIYSFIIVYPTFHSLFYSFTDWTGNSASFHFVGLGNFKRLASDPGFRKSFSFTVKFVLIVVTAVNLLAIVLAVMIQSLTRGGNLSKTLIYLPVIFSQVAGGFIWKAIYSYDGPANRLIRFLIPGADRVPWLIDPDMALWSISLVEIWRITGWHMMIVYAALQTVPGMLYEAAEIDGCRVRDKFFRITLPLILPGIMTSVMMSTIGTLKQFGIIKTMTDGGPGGATASIAFTIINEAFVYNRRGYASAVALVLMVGIGLITWLQNRFFQQREVDY